MFKLTCWILDSTPFILDFCSPPVAILEVNSYKAIFCTTFVATTVATLDSFSINPIRVSMAESGQYLCSPASAPVFLSQSVILIRVVVYDQDILCLAYLSPPPEQRISRIFDPPQVVLTNRSYVTTTNLIHVHRDHFQVDSGNRVVVVVVRLPIHSAERWPPVVIFVGIELDTTIVLPMDLHTLWTTKGSVSIVKIVIA